MYCDKVDWIKLTHMCSIVGRVGAVINFRVSEKVRNTELVLQPPAYQLFYHKVARSLETACHYAFSNIEVKSQPLLWKRKEL